MTRQSTRILKPSQQKYFEEKFTDSLEDIPVSRSVARGSEKEKKTQGTCGHTSEDTSEQLALPGFLPKMSEATPRWGYGESCPIWKKMVTERSSDCSRRRKQARLTNASECSSWPTPRTGGGSRPNGKGGKVLDEEVKIEAGLRERGKILAEEAKKNWATPNTMDHLPPKTGEALARNKKKGGCKNLREDVNNPQMNWPTASASDTEGGSQADRVEWTEKGATLRKKNKPHMTYGAKLRDAVENHEHAGPPAQEKSSTSGKNHGSPKLNPNWVEQLMGLPIGWTDLGSWATESSHKPQN